MRNLTPIVWLSLAACHGEDVGPDLSARVDVAVDFGGFVPRNIVVVHVDTLRQDHLALYGYERSTLPLLEALDWVQVRRHYAATSWTGPSSASLMSSLDIHHHGVRFAESPDPDTLNQTLTMPTFSEYLGALDYHTGLCSGNGYVSEGTNISKGFDFTCLSKQEPANNASLA
jgi:arylsulfatase A-like enzyme